MFTEPGAVPGFGDLGLGETWFWPRVFFDSLVMEADPQIDILCEKVAIKE